MSSDGALTNPAIDRAEHDDVASAKRVLEMSWNGSGTTKTPAPFVDLPYDEIALSSYDTNGIPATIEYKLQGTTVRTLTLTVTGGHITDIVRT